jgi:RNA polymerase sigma-70 factor (ECF subfamily)
MTSSNLQLAPSIGSLPGEAPEPRGGIEPAPVSAVRLSDDRRRVAGMADAALVRSALGGDASAAPAIWRRYVPLVRRRLGAYFNGAELEDHVQEVFARCFEHLPRLRNPTSLRSYLIGITLRLALFECRRRRFRSWASVTATGELPDEGVSDDIEARLVAARMRELLGKLKPDSCHLLELRFVRGHELTEVAETMGVSLATAKRHLARASAHVRALAEREPVVAEYLRDACGPRAARGRSSISEMNLRLSRSQHRCP